MKKLIRSLILTLAVAGLAASSAFAVSLQNLVDNNGSISIGDKTFSNFGYHAVGLSGFDANQINVTASVDGAGVYYLTWQGSIALLSGGFATADLLLNYRVTANPGVITSIDQFYAGSVQGGIGFIAIDEIVRNGASVLANSHLQADDLSDEWNLTEPGDQLTVNPGQHVLDVTKDIGFGLLNGGFITISEVSQSFHQSVPDGGLTIAFLGSALVGLGLLRRRLS